MKNGFLNIKRCWKKRLSLLKFLIDSDYTALLPKFLYLCGAIFMVFAAISETELF